MNHGHDDYAVEPIPGLPERPPEGERVLWQGAPEWRRLARQVFHVRAVGLYFLALILWRAGARLAETGDARLAVATALGLLPIALIGVGLLALLAWLSARSTIYTITNRRVVLRIGVALPTAINIPFRLVESADLKAASDGIGDIALKLMDSERIGYSTLWPHARPFAINKPRPMLRAIPNAATVAALLGSAVADALPAATLRAGDDAAAKEVAFPTLLKHA